MTKALQLLAAQSPAASGEQGTDRRQGGRGRGRAGQRQSAGFDRRDGIVAGPGGMHYSGEETGALTGRDLGLSEEVGTDEVARRTAFGKGHRALVGIVEVFEH